MKVFGPILLMAAVLPQTLGLRIVGEQGPSSQLQMSDIIFDGAKGTNCGDDEFAYGNVGVRNVSGTRHFFLYMNSVATSKSFIASGSSSTVFTVNAGHGSDFSPTMQVGVVRGGQAVGSYPELTVIQTVAGDVLTVSPALGGTPANGDFVYYEAGDAIADYTDSGTWKAPASADNLSTCTVHTNPYHGKRTSWDVDGRPRPYPLMQQPIPGEMHWNATRGLLYLTYEDTYGGSTHDWNVMAYNPDTDTSYGPWRTKVTNGDAITRWGGFGCIYLNAQHDDASKFGCGSSGGQALSTNPFGPNIYEGFSFPLTSDTAGYAAPDRAATNRAVEYYSMGDTVDNTSGNFFTWDGAVHGILRSQKYATTTYGRVWEGIWDSTVFSSNPANLGGYSTWHAQDTSSGFYDYRGAKSGTIFLVNLIGREGGNNVDCTLGAHDWYSNSGVGHINVHGGSGGTGWVQGTSIIGSIQGNTGYTVRSYGYDGNYGSVLYDSGGSTTPFLPGETITSGSASAIVDAFHNHGTCSHGCSTNCGITGPCTNTGFTPGPNFEIYSNTDLDAVRAASGVGDYAVVPTAVADLRNTYGVVIGSGIASGVNGIAIDPIDPKIFYIVAHKADTRIAARTYIYKFHINDTVPEPTLMGWLWALAPHWMTGHSRPVPRLLESPR